MSARETIAIIAWGAMADVLYATPIVRQIRRMFPRSYIIWLVRDKFSDVIAGNRDINEVRTFTLPEGYPSRQDAEYVMDKEILEYAKDFDRYYDLQYWPRYSNFYENPTEDFIALRARNAGLNPAQIVDRSIALEFSREDDKHIMYWRMDKGIYNPKKRFITVNHISYAASPVWAFENYDKLVDILDHEHNIKSVFTGAPNEPIPEHCIDARGMPYRQWAHLIGSSDLFLGLDSGAKALAASTDTPMIILQSKDFQLQKTGCVAMGIRTKDVWEMITPPNVESLASFIQQVIV
jgi:ADP-heptose:LPS heptosyltransferase